MSEIVYVTLVTGEQLVCVVQPFDADESIDMINPSMIINVEGEYDLAPYSPFSHMKDKRMRVFNIKNEHVVHITEPMEGAKKLFEMYHIEGKAEEAAQALADSQKAKSPIYTGENDPNNVIILPPKGSKQLHTTKG